MLIDDDEIIVFVDDLELRVGELRVATTGRDGNDIARLEGKIVARLNGITYLDAALS